MGLNPSILGPTAKAAYARQTAASPQRVPSAVISARIKAGKERSKKAAKEFQNICERAGIEKPWLECRFHPERGWLFDFAWPAQKLAMEVDGGVFMRGGGGHSSAAGFRRDFKKLNSAAVLGWRILRVFPEQLLKIETVDMVRMALRGAWRRNGG